MHLSVLPISVEIDLMHKLVEEIDYLIGYIPTSIVSTTNLIACRVSSGGDR